MRRTVLTLLLSLSTAFIFGSGFNTIERVFYGVKPGVTLDGIPVGGLLYDEVRQLVTTLGAEQRQSPQPARLTKDGHIIPQVQGRELDVMATVKQVMAAKRRQKIEPVFIPIDTPYTADMVRACTRTLGSFRTYISGSEDRLENIKLAAKEISNTLVWPGDFFSFNNTLGPTTPERGFREAPIIVGEEFTTGTGGGVCQVSTTLYNAVLKAGLEVVERHPHTQPVHYVPPGKDAAVAYGYKDFVFRNDLDWPVIVRAKVSGRAIRIDILSR